MKERAILIHAAPPVFDILDGLSRISGKRKKRIVADLIIAEAAKHPELSGLADLAKKSMRLPKGA